MSLLLLALLGCEPKNVDETGEPPTACDCDDVVSEAFTVTESGGFDDWGGAALTWAVDGQAGRVLVVAMNYETGVGQIRMEPDCEAADDIVGAWVVDVSPGFADAVSRYPLLGTALTTEAGVRSLPEDIGAVLLEGDLAGTTPDWIRVATGANVTLLRLEGGDTLQGALEFGAVADGVPGHAEAGCETAVRLGALDISW